MSSGTTALGIIGGLLFASACAPMAWKTIQTGKSVVTDRTSIWTFVFATLFFGVYLLDTTGANIVSGLIFFEFICWSVVAKYSYYPRKLTKAVKNGSGCGIFRGIVRQLRR